MKKRLRKKLHIGEFVKYGFLLQFPCSPKDEEKCDSVVDLIIAACESLDLDVGGGCNMHSGGSFFVTWYHKSCTEEHRQQLDTALKEAGLGEYHVGPLVDSNKGSPLAAAIYGTGQV